MPELSAEEESWGTGNPRPLEETPPGGVLSQPGESPEKWFDEDQRKSFAAAIARAQQEEGGALSQLTPAQVRTA